MDVVLGDMCSLRCDRFSVVVVKPDEPIKCPDHLNDRELWKNDGSCDPSKYIEQRCVILLLRLLLLQLFDDDDDDNDFAVLGTGQSGADPMGAPTPHISGR